MDIYTTLFKTKKFIGSQPITFNKDTYNPAFNYYTTHKLDGLRKLLILTQTKKAQLISSKLDIKYFILPLRPFLNNTVLDCEFIEKNKKVYVFDILFYKGKDVRDKNLTERLVLIKDIINSLNSKKVILKEYLSPYFNSVNNNFNILKQQYSNELKNGEVDGIIFTPDTSYLKGIPLKWKPNYLLSIDFKIKKLGDNKIALLTQNGTIFKYKNKYKNKYTGIVLLSDKEYEYYDDGDIVEFIFENGKFKPIKVRKDKVKSNHISVILSNMKTILDPPDVKKILETT